jgi:hypothetical protein
VKTQKVYRKELKTNQPCGVGRDKPHRYPRERRR